MVEQSGKGSIIAIGTLGHGKSTVLNTLSGVQETFKTSSEARSCT